MMINPQVHRESAESVITSQPEPGPCRNDVLQSLPQRRSLKVRGQLRPPPRMEKIEFRASNPRVVLRLFTWLRAAAYFCWGELVDRLYRRASRDRRAVRLRHTFERVGGTFVKLGQQLSLRLDLLPFEYCRELANLLDRGKPMPLSKGIDAVERAVGKPIADVFAAFDPDPIGSASIACVYQAVLKSGERVAVKIRRPEIGNTFSEDLKALKWLLRTLEWLTILRPGFSRNLHWDLQSMLMDELDFRQEARFQELFRRYARKDKQDHVTAPRLYPELSSAEVICQEYVEGITLSELLEAVDHDDQDTLASLAKMGITPKKVAKRLGWTLYWSTQENLFFHADPHPANIFIQAKSRLVLIDFGACGSTHHKARRQQREVYHRLARHDIEGAARVALSIMEPLPRIAITELRKRAEAVWWKKIYALRSRHAPWWERTSASLWLAVLEVTRGYQIPLNLDVLRTIRATLLYDTLAARLWPKVSDRLFGEYERKSYKRRAEQASALIREVSDPAYMLSQAHELLELGERLRYKVELFADSQVTNFQELTNKASFAVIELLRFSWFAVALLLFLASGWQMCVAASGGAIDIFGIIQRSVLHPVYLSIVTFRGLLLLRRIGFRLHDKDM